MANGREIPLANQSNDRIKRRYFSYLKDARGRDAQSISHVANAIARFERHTSGSCFKDFKVTQAVEFKEHLHQTKNPRTGAPLSMTTMHGILSHLRAFFQWLSKQPSFKARLNYDEADYFNLSEKERRVANATRPKNVPTLDQIEKVLRSMPTTTDIERRNRALVAFALLTGARASALVSARLKHVDIETRHFYQDAREVRTKFSKTISTWFFPVGAYAESIVVDWVSFLRVELRYAANDPVFPSTLIEGGEQQKFEVSGISRKHWASAESLRAIFREAFAGAGLAYSNPHTMRNVLARLGTQVCKTAEELNAWADNLGHNDVLTTLRTYGRVPDYRRQEIFDGMRKGPAPTNDGDQLLRKLKALIADQDAGSSAGSG